MKMGIIGYGGMAHWHRSTINEIDGLEVGGIWDIKEAARKQAEEEGLKVYSGREEMLRDKEIAFVLVCTDNDTHAEIAMDAMRKGKHVVCEKPVTLSSELLEAMIEVSKQTGMLLTVHQNRRWDKDFCTLKEVLHSGVLGEVFRIESRVHGSRGISDTWRRKKERGGGVIYDWGVHLFDQILLLKQGVNLKSVYAISHHVTTASVEDGFTAILTFVDGLQVMVEVETSNFVGFPRWYVYGSNGTLCINDWDATGKIVRAVDKDKDDAIPFVTPSGFTKTMAPRRDDTIIESPLPIVQSDITEFYKNIMAVLQGKESSLITVTEMRNVIRLIEAVFESIQKNQAVECKFEF